MKKIAKSTPQILLPFHTVATLKERLSWYINLRWVAVIGVLISVPIGENMLKFNLAYKEITVIAAILLLINIIYFFLVRHIKFRNEYHELAFAEVQIIIDLVIISFLIHNAGGIGNPFFFLYIVQVILSGILFPGYILPYVNAVFAALLLTCWSMLEHFNIVPRIILRDAQIPLPLLITSLAAFYITIFAGIYIISHFMIGYRSLKTVIDEKNLQLLKAMKDRSKAFRFAAHELKSPMVAIQSTLEVVKVMYGKDLKPEVMNMVFKAESRSEQVLNMIKELITITQYNLGIEQPVFEKIYFNKWLNRFVDQQIEYALKKNILLTCGHLKDDILVNIDTNGLEKIVNNLVTNAVRYTPEGGEVIVVPFADEEHFGFKVTDTGIGIAEEDFSKIFDEFFRSKNAREMERIGTGLGLNLVLEIVKHYNGNVYVKSELGKGSEFTVEFPYSCEESEEEHSEGNKMLVN